MAKKPTQDGGERPKRRTGGKGSRTTAKKVQRLEDQPPPKHAAESTHDGSGGQPPRNLPRIDFHAEGDDEAYDPNDRDNLKRRQRAFVEAYCGAAGGRAAEAARLAGYSDSNANVLNVTASRLLSNANVQRAISRKMGEKFGGPEDVVRSIAEIGRGNAADYIEWNDAGQLQISLEKLAAAGQLGLVHEIREEGIDAGGGQVVVIKRKLKLYDKLRALELLAKINGQLKEQPILPGEIVVKHIWNDPKTGEGVGMRDLLNPNAEGGDPPDEDELNFETTGRRSTLEDIAYWAGAEAMTKGYDQSVNPYHEHDQPNLFQWWLNGWVERRRHRPNGSEDAPTIAVCPFCSHDLAMHGDGGCSAVGCECTNNLQPTVK